MSPPQPTQMSEQSPHSPEPPTQEELRENVKKRILSYNDGIISGKIQANKWIYAAAKRFENDLTRSDVYFDWDEAFKLVKHFESLTLVGEWSGKPFHLQDWQLYTYSNVMCWKWTESKTRRFKIAIIQIARGAGKSSTAAGLCLYDMFNGMGKRVHVLANSVEQAEIILTTAKTMVERMPEDSHDFVLHYSMIASRERDCEMTALPALEKALDGKTLSFAVADEASEFRGRTLTKLITALGKRKESTLLITTTPGYNPENHYYEMVRTAESILSGEVSDDTFYAMLYGLDKEDALEDETMWVKANPGLSYGQPDLQSLRRSWNTMRQSPMGRSEFCRYHASRMDENTGGWLDMTDWEKMVDKTIDDEFLAKRPCYGGLDLSKSCDMTALVLCFPLDDGRIYIKGRYWFPKDGLAQRELDYRMPCRTWAAEGKLELSAGREIDYEQIRVAINEARETYDLKTLGYDAWGSKYLAENLQADGVPIQTYRMSAATFAPGCQLWQNQWMGRKLVFGDDPVMRRACAEAVAKRDINGNIRPVKPREHAIIDPLVAGIIAVHVYGGKPASIYEQEADIINGVNRSK